MPKIRVLVVDDAVVILHAQREVAVSEHADGTTVDIAHRQETNPVVAHQSCSVLRTRVDGRRVNLVLHDFAAQHELL